MAARVSAAAAFERLSEHAVSEHVVRALRSEQVVRALPSKHLGITALEIPPMSEPADQATTKPATVKLGGKDFSLPDAEAFCRRFANGFFWIAGLSLINMFAIATDSGFAMVLGLGVTQLMQAFALATNDPVWMLMSYVVGCAAI